MKTYTLQGKSQAWPGNPATLAQWGSETGGSLGRGGQAGSRISEKPEGTQRRRVLEQDILHTNTSTGTQNINVHTAHTQSTANKLQGTIKGLDCMQLL